MIVNPQREQHPHIPSGAIECCLDCRGHHGCYSHRTGRWWDRGDPACGDSVPNPESFERDERLGLVM